VGGDTGEWDPSGRCSHFLFGSPPRSAWKISSANFAVTEFYEVRELSILGSCATFGSNLSYTCCIFEGRARRRARCQRNKSTT
jgi:hypothetical protein